MNQIEKLLEQQQLFGRAQPAPIITQSKVCVLR